MHLSILFCFYQKQYILYVCAFKFRTRTPRDAREHAIDHNCCVSVGFRAARTRFDYNVT